jgi:hypothetical protein
VKRKTFYYLSLLLPYSALLISAVFAFASGVHFFEDPPSASFLIELIVFFTFSAIIWAPLYTWMAVALFFWGRGKNANEIRRMYLFAPVLLGCAVGLPALVMDIRSSVLLLLWGFLRIANLDFIQRTFFEKYSPEEPFTVGLIWAFMAALCLIVGYGFVGLVLLIERGMQRLRLFEEEDDITSFADGAKI